MVLIQSTASRFLIAILLVSTLNACSFSGSQKHNNRSPNSPIIPVKTTTSTPPINQTNQTPTVHEANKVHNKTELQTLGDETKNPSKQKKLSPSDVLDSVIDSAKKALSMQQWLRAQHHLEHALRIAPKDAQVFLLYAQVYEGLGVKEQEINMLKRAIFLAKPKTEIHTLAKEKLAQKEE
jgi:regulator of sirC expression with transglutaminase-like and TPR domain